LLAIRASAAIALPVFFKQLMMAYIIATSATVDTTPKTEKIWRISSSRLWLLHLAFQNKKT
jgi:uncharacterized membrane protein YsdA (DUF1294 family)